MLGVPNISDAGFGVPGMSSVKQLPSFESFGMRKVQLKKGLAPNVPRVVTVDLE